MSAEHALIQAALSVWPFKGDDHQPIDIGVEAGVVWAISVAPTAGINGYALIPGEGHVWSKEVPYVEVEGGYDNGGWEESEASHLMEVHGGITYDGRPWIGFDTCHSGDIWPAKYDRFGITRRYDHPCSWDHEWTVDEVAEEAKSLARQVAALMIPSDACSLEVS